MRTGAELPNRLTDQGSGAGQVSVRQREAGGATARRRGARKVLRTVVSAVVIVAIFGFALPRFASYRSVWASIEAMTWGNTVLVATAAAASMASYWFLICAVLAVYAAAPRRRRWSISAPTRGGERLRRCSGALGIGVSWAMMSSWGVSTADYVLYTLVSGIWNVLARLGLPVLALLVMLTATPPDAALIAAAAVGLAVLVIVAAGLGLLVHSESFALRTGGVLQHVLAAACRLVRRQPPCDIPGSLLGFRSRAAALIAKRGLRITAAIVASHLMLWLVLLACLRAVSLSQAQLPWQTSLAAFAFIRLLTAMPITPGGLGITELGLIGTLAAGAGAAGAAQVTAAVLLYRAVTYLPPIPLGAITYLVWQHAPALIHASPAGDEPEPAGLRAAG